MKRYDLGFVSSTQETGLHEGMMMNSGKLNAILNSIAGMLEDGDIEPVRKQVITLSELTPMSLLESALLAQEVATLNGVISGNQLAELLRRGYERSLSMNFCFVQDGIMLESLFSQRCASAVF